MAQSSKTLISLLLIVLTLGSASAYCEISDPDACDDLSDMLVIVGQLSSDPFQISTINLTAQGFPSEIDTVCGDISSFLEVSQKEGKLRRNRNRRFKGAQGQQEISSIDSSFLEVGTSAGSQFKTTSLSASDLIFAIQFDIDCVNAAADEDLDSGVLLGFQAHCTNILEPFFQRTFFPNVAGVDDTTDRSNYISESNTFLGGTVYGILGCSF